MTVVRPGSSGTSYGPFGPMGPYREPGPVERFLGRLVEGLIVGFVILLFGTVALLALGFGLSWLLTSVLVPAGGDALTLLSAFTPPPVDALILEALLGLVVGIGVGLLRYRARVQSRLTEDLVDAVASPEVVSAFRLGASYVAVHALSGLLAGALVGWLGLPLPDLLRGHAEAALAHATPLVTWLVGSGGPGGADGAGLLGLLLLVLVAALLALLAGGAASLGLGGLAAAMASRGAGTVGSSFGLALALTLSRLHEDVPRLSRRPRAEPFTPEVAMRAWWAATFASDADRSAVAEYVQWAVAQGVDPLDPDDERNRKRFCGFVGDQGRAPSQAIWRFAEWLPQGLADQRSPRKAVATDDRLWLDAVAAQVFTPGWVRRTIATGALAGAITGAVQAALAGGLLLLLAR